MIIKQNELIFEKTDDPNVVICYRLDISKIHLDKLEKKHSDLITEVIKYKTTKVISEELGKLMLSMGRIMYHKTIFGNGNIKDDLISESTVYFIKALDSVNKVEPNNYFSYFTKVIKNSFLGYLEKEYNWQKIKTICYDNQADIVDKYKISPMALDYTSLRPEYA